MVNENVLIELSRELGINYLIVKSWAYQGFFSSKQTWKQFFQENIEIIKAKPFIKWVGWKRQLINQFQKLFPKEFNNYHEPFLWAWAVFFAIQKKQSFLSDINEDLINTWQVIKNNPIELINFLKTLKYSKEQFLEIRAWDREDNWKEKYSSVQRAWRFLYLNRTCFNWLYRVNSKWQFNVPFGKYKNPDFIQEENILNVSKLLNKTQANIQVASFEKVLENVKKGDFVYFDPPYDVLSSTANFTSYTQDWFGKQWQIKLAEVFRQLDNMWVKLMLSNHNTPLIQELYKDYKIDIVKARRNVNSKADKRWEVEEVVVRNY
jgi:DNA adenine methylase